MATTIDQQRTSDDVRIPPEVLDDPLAAMFSDLLVAEDAGLGAEIQPEASREEPCDPPAIPDPVEFAVAPEIDTASGGLPEMDQLLSQVLADEAAAETPAIPEETRMAEAAAEEGPASPFPLAIVPEPLLDPAPAAAAARFEEPSEEPSETTTIPPPRQDDRLGTDPDAGMALSCDNGLDSLISEIDRENRPVLGDDLFVEANRAAAAATQLDSCIVFLLAETRYALPIRSVLELDAMPRVTTVPNVPGFVRGVTNLRGEIVVVLDLRALLGLAAFESAERGRILVVRTKDQQTAALAVDEVRGTAALALAELAQSPIHDALTPFLLGVGEHQDRVLNVLDLDKLFGMPELQQLTAS
ncbi:MAG TPA: chemotaxis protein CheW [Candidatus Acidoferrales bacterium]|nr:chemotaxis protein CheW [Candidatus Acidoferrales bacterium]